MKATLQQAVGACVDIAVRDSCGAYVTPTVRGQRASSTSSAEAAALKLAQKLYGVSAAVLFMQRLEAGVQVYRIAPTPGALDTEGTAQ